MAVAAHPSDLARRVADHQRVVRHILRHHRTGADEGITADGDPAHDGGVGADRAAPLESAWSHISEWRFTWERGIGDVGQHAGRAEEHVIFDTAPV